MYLGGSRPSDTPVNTHEGRLSGAMTYVAYPPPDDALVTRYEKMVHTLRACPPSNFLSDRRVDNRSDDIVLFLGQIPRLLPLNYVPWVLDLLLADYCVSWVLQTQTNGCAKAWVFMPEQAFLLKSLNKCLLFDVCGVWVAKTAEEQVVMTAYQIELNSGTLLIDSRVPRNGMVIEASKRHVNSQALFQVPRPGDTPLPPHNSGNSRRVTFRPV